MLGTVKAGNVANSSAITPNTYHPTPKLGGTGGGGLELPSKGALMKASVLGDITSHRLIVVKGFLFLLAGMLAAGGILLEVPSLRVAFLLAVAVWCFARFYYFMFYVIEHYVDPGYKFAGLGSFVAWLFRRRRAATREPLP